MRMKKRRGGVRNPPKAKRSGDEMRWDGSEAKQSSDVHGAQMGPVDSLLRGRRTGRRRRSARTQVPRGVGVETCVDERDRRRTVRRSDVDETDVFLTECGGSRRGTNSPCLRMLPCAFHACEWMGRLRAFATRTVGWKDLASHPPLSRCRRGISSPTLSSDLVPLRVLHHLSGDVSPGSTRSVPSDGTGMSTRSSFLDRPSLLFPFSRPNRS